MAQEGLPGIIVARPKHKMTGMEEHLFDHPHEHSEVCGHTKIKHDGHIDYVHHGHLHHKHDGHWDECVIPVSEQNPSDGKLVASSCQHNDDCGHERIPHGDHYDYLVDGRLQHVTEKGCYDHGPVKVLKTQHT